MWTSFWICKGVCLISEDSCGVDCVEPIVLGSSVVLGLSS